MDQGLHLQVSGGCVPFPSPPVAAHTFRRMPDIVVLEFMRSPEFLKGLVLESELLAAHRAEMLSVGRLCFFDDRAKLLATAEDVHDVLHFFSVVKFIRWDDGSTCAIGEEGLRPRHVVVSAAWEADFLQALSQAPGPGCEGGKCFLNVKVRRKATLAICRGPWH
jgi:hypothetical protein